MPLIESNHPSVLVSGAIPLFPRQPEIGVFPTGQESLPREDDARGDVSPGLRKWSQPLHHGELCRLRGLLGGKRGSDALV